MADGPELTAALRGRIDLAAARSAALREQLGRQRARDEMRRVAAAAEMAQRWAMEAEGALAALQEQAAQLYELSVGEGAAVMRIDDVGGRGRDETEDSAVARSTERFVHRVVGALERRVEMRVGEPGRARRLMVLAALERLRALVDQRVSDCVVACREEGASWGEVAAALQVSRQAAHSRYRRAAAGGSAASPEAVAPHGVVKDS